MWVIRQRPCVNPKPGQVYVYEVGFNLINMFSAVSFEVIETFEDKNEAMKLCHYLNGGYKEI